MPHNPTAPEVRATLAKGLPGDCLKLQIQPRTQNATHPTRDAEEMPLAQTQEEHTHSLQPADPCKTATLTALLQVAAILPSTSLRAGTRQLLEVPGSLLKQLSLL